MKRIDSPEFRSCRCRVLRGFVDTSNQNRRNRHDWRESSKLLLSTDLASRVDVLDHFSDYDSLMAGRSPLAAPRNEHGPLTLQERFDLATIVPSGLYSSRGVPRHRLDDAGWTSNTQQDANVFATAKFTPELTPNPIHTVYEWGLACF
jgi:hypothetical protein